MAISATKTKQLSSTGGAVYNLTAYFIENSTDTNNNTSNITGIATFQATNGYWTSTYNSTIELYWYDNNQYTNGFLVARTYFPGLASATDNAIAEYTINVPHKADGTLNGYVKAVFIKGSTTSPFAPADNNVSTDNTTLTTIPRGFTTKPKVSLVSATDKSLVIKWETSENCDRVDYNISGTSVQEAWTGNAKTGNITISNLQEGKTYAVYIWCRKRDSQVGQISDTKNMNTYAKPTNTLNTKTETAIKVNWNAGDYIDRIRYSNDNGSTWSEWTTINAKSGNYTISGLTAKTTYNIKTQLRWKSNNNITSTTDKLSVDTYQYPYVKSITTSNLKIGGTQKIKLFNPLNRNVTVYMKPSTASAINCGQTTNGTDVEYSFTPNATSLNNSIPNATSGSATYYCTYSGQTGQTVSGTYYIDNSGDTYNPTFTTSNWSYAANYTSLTNNNKVVIKGKSTITFTVNTSATAKNGASIASYKVEWGTKSNTITGATGSTTLSGGIDTTLKITAVDSRGYSTLSSLSLGNNLINYTDPTLTGSTEREDGIGTDTTLDLNGTFFNSKFGSSGTQNSIISAKYYTSTNNTTWSNAYTIPVSSFTISGNNITLNDYQIHANGSSGGFPIGTKYYIKIDIQDAIQTKTFTGIVVTDGKIAVDCYQDSNGDYHRGINGLASSSYTQYVHGNIGVDRGQEVDVGSGGIIGSTDHDDAFVYGTGGWIYLRPKGKNNTTNQFTFKSTGEVLAPKSFVIPKNATNGYGITNSDGTSILRDHNNTNVTLEATGGILFLGYQTTTGLRFLKDKVIMNSDGEITTDLTLKRGNVNTTLNIGDTSYKKQNEVRTRNNTLDIGIGVDTGGTFRIWNYTHSKEVIRVSSAGANSFNGNASTATKATQDGSGNTITSTYLMKKNVARGRVSITPSAANTPTSATVSWGKTMDGEPTCTATANSSASQIINTAVTGLSSTGGTIWLLASNTTARNVFYIAIYV